MLESTAAGASLQVDPEDRFGRQAQAMRLINFAVPALHAGSVDFGNRYQSSPRLFHTIGWQADHAIFQC